MRRRSDAYRRALVPRMPYAVSVLVLRHESSKGTNAMRAWARRKFGQHNFMTRAVVDGSDPRSPWHAVEFRFAEELVAEEFAEKFQIQRLIQRTSS